MSCHSTLEKLLKKTNCGKSEVKANFQKYRCVPIDFSKKESKKGNNLVSEAATLVEVDSMRQQSKHGVDPSAVFRRKANLDSKLGNPSIVNRKTCARQFDDRFISMLGDASLEANGRDLKTSMTSSKPFKVKSMSALPSRSPSVNKSLVDISSNHTSQLIDKMTIELDAKQWSIKKPHKRCNSMSQVVNAYRKVRKTEIIQKINESRLNNADNKRTVIGSDMGVHKKKAKDFAVSEDDRVHLAAFMGNKWINELTYPTNFIDSYGQKIITPELDMVIKKTMNKLRVRQTIDKSIRYQFYRQSKGGANFRYSKDHELNLVFNRMHNQMVDLNQIKAMEDDYAQIEASTYLFNSDEKIPEVVKKERKLRHATINVLKDLNKSTIPGMITFEILEKVTQKMYQAISSQNSKSKHNLIYSGLWKKVRKAIDKMIEYKYLTNARMEDIDTFSLINCISMPPYKTIGILDAVRNSDCTKLRDVIQRDRLIKYCLDAEEQTPLIKAVGRSTPQFVKFMLDIRMPINHRDKVVRGLCSSRRQLCSMRLGEEISLSS